MIGFLLRPDLLPLLVAAPLVGFFLHGLERRRARRLARLAGGRHAAEGGRWSRVAVASGLLLATAALLEPVWGEGPQRATDRGADVIVCLDVSRSMLARDEDGSRLQAARREIRALAERARGDRVGLVLFAGEARLAVPLTRDAATFTRLLEDVDSASVARGGTDLAAALVTAADALRAAHGAAAIVLVTDGEDQEGRALRAADACRSRGIVVHCAGFGSPEGAKIVVEGDAGETFLRDRSGREVVSSLDRTSLTRVAAATGGEYVDAHGRRGSLVEIYERGILLSARTIAAEEERRERIPRFQIPLLAAFALWILPLAFARSVP